MVQKGPKDSIPLSQSQAKLLEVQGPSLARPAVLPQTSGFIWIGYFPFTVLNVSDQNERQCCFLYDSFLM